MMRRATLLPALLVIASALAPAAGAAQVRGHVTDAASGDPVSGALVWLSGRTVHLTRSMTDGSYAFDRAPPGSYCIRVDYPGYDGARVCISVSANARMIVDLPLSARPVTIAPLVVTGRRGAIQPGRDMRDTLRATLARQELALSGTRSTALAAAQLTDLAHVPGPDRGEGGRPQALYVWGSSAERGRVLLDGASLNAPLHLGALLPPLDPNIIAAAAVRSGGISPRYDGGTSYIMDFTTRSPAHDAGTWGELDMIAGGIGAETPVNGRGRVLVSARRVNNEVLDGLMSSRFGYGYADALARADVDLGSDHGIHLTALTTHEAVSIPRDLAEDRASWNNHAATLVWRQDRADRVRSATVSVSRGIADLPLLSAVGGHLEANLDRVGALAHQRWRAGPLAWNAGVEVEHLMFRRRSRASQDPATGDPGPVSCTPSLPCSNASATFASTFTELSLSPARSVQTSLGARVMYDLDTKQMRLMPRASVTVLPSDRYSFTLAGGRFSQAYVRDPPRSAGALAGSASVDVHVARATHLELGVARHSGPGYIRAGAYLRRHSPTGPTARPRTVPGADLGVEYATAVGIVSLAYGVSGGTAAVHADSVRDGVTQHLATAGFSGGYGRWRLDVTGAWGSGLPLTSIVLEHPVSAEIVFEPSRPLHGGADGLPRGRSYLRVDAMLGAEWRIAKAGGVTLMPYARVINALGQRESLFYFQDDDAAQPRGLARLPAVPMIGLRWQFQ